MIRIQQIRSPIRRPGDQRLTLIGLGLNRIGRIANVPDTPQTWGMITKVRHLIRIVGEDLLAEHRLVRPKKGDEAADIKLVHELLFEPCDIVASRFSNKEMRSGDTPDFKLLQGGLLRGYCELKSPWYDWALDFPKDLQAGEVRAEVRPAQAAPNLAGHIQKAASQFDAVNPDHALPNILVMVNHAQRRDVKDLHLALVGMPVPDGQALPVLDEETQNDLWKAARSIDLYVWVDPKKRTYQYVRPLGAAHLTEACDLFGISASEPTG